jgi:hypothetical protein
MERKRRNKKRIKNKGKVYTFMEGRNEAGKKENKGGMTKSRKRKLALAVLFIKLFRLSHFFHILLVLFCIIVYMAVCFMLLFV